MQALGATFVPFWRVDRRAEVGSTNSEVAEAARRGEAEGLVIVADHQLAGRGRAGRPWVDGGDGAVLASVLLRPELEAAQLFLVTAVVSLAASDACEATTGWRPVGKWPNDLMSRDADAAWGAKLAGILAEVLWPPGSGGPEPAVVAGLGCNLSGPLPLGASSGTTLEAASGARVGREEFLAALLSSLSGRYGALATPGGRAAQLEAYRAGCATIGAEVTVELPGGAWRRGVAVAVADDGQLELEGDGERRRLAAGDVTHVRPAGGPRKAPA